MNRAARWLLSAGVLLFIGVIASQGLATVVATLAIAGWGLLLVALFHLLPLAIDAAAIRVLFTGFGSMRDALLTRWLGESANGLMPGGVIGGPVFMARYLAQRGLMMQDAAAAITVSTTLQTFAQIGFALLGVALLGAHGGQNSETALRTSSLVASGLLAIQLGGFYLMQRRGLFSKLMHAATRFFGKRDWGKRDWSERISQAQAIDAAVEITYGRAGAVALSFVLSLVGWLVGTGEVYLILELLRSPVSWSDALMLESLGQAVRGAGFAIPGALGVQEGGYMLLAPLAGLAPQAGLALSLAKRARELLLGLPGLLFLHFRAGAGTARIAPR
jgi:putative membrane protein